jgi:triacylglycerol lipase
LSTENPTSNELSGSETSAADAAAQVHVDPTLTVALAQASLAAYADFENNPKFPVVPPANYRYVTDWTGWDASIIGGSVEKFGVLFQSTLVPTTFIFAFRGTDSDLDAWEDLFVETTAFVPYRGHVSPVPYVSAGFYDIYDTAGGGMRQSMRQQLFSLLEQYRPQKIYITGHSLGAALSHLFTLDVSVSSPGLWAANMNFASPRVGTAGWRTVYESQPAQGDAARKTIRVYNYYDFAPTVPPELFGYEHVGTPFRTSFKVKAAWVVHPDARHSILNLQTVLGRAVVRAPQVWAGTFPDATYLPSHRLMQSFIPSSAAEAAWVEKMTEFMEFERTLQTAPPGSDEGG